MKSSYIPALAVGMGAAAGLRSMTPPAVLAWAAKRKLIRIGHSPIAEIISAQVSRKAVELAVSELIADKLPFTPRRTKPGPLTARILSGAACGAVLCSAVEEPLLEGAILGGLGALVGTFAGYHLRRKLARNMSEFPVALVEDVLAVAGSAAIVAYVADRT